MAWWQWFLLGPAVLLTVAALWLFVALTVGALSLVGHWLRDRLRGWWSR